MPGCHLTPEAQEGTSLAESLKTRARAGKSRLGHTKEAKIKLLGRSWGRHLRGPHDSGPRIRKTDTGLTAQQEVRRMTNLEGRRRSLEEAGR